MNFNIRRVLVAPLDWGLGHATRCVPIIQALLSHGYEVLLAAEKAQAVLLQKEFPQLVCLPLKGYRVRYSRSRRLLAFRIIQQLPGLLSIIRKEHAWLDRTIDEYRIDLVISDNRYGLYSDKAPCVFITHQLTIKAPFAWLEKALQRINYRYLNRFTACWVPDIEGENNLAGILSHPVIKPAIPVHYIGLLSRFSQKAETIRYAYCILLSGPEPQRSILEEKILSDLEDIAEPMLLIRGLPAGSDTLDVPPNVTVKDHLPTPQMQEALQQSGLIISRSGYTTVMELVSLRKRSLLIPTPGQTEQEYLAQRLYQNNTCYTVSQEKFRCREHLALAQSFDYALSDMAVFDPVQVKQLLEDL